MRPEYALSAAILTVILLAAGLLSGVSWAAAAGAGRGAVPEGITVEEWGAIQGQVAKLNGSDSLAEDGFGVVSVHLGIAVVGAPKADVGTNADQGAAYVYYRDQGGPHAWGQVAKLVAGDGAAGDQFGYAVSIHDDTIIVGAWKADVDGKADQGAAYIYQQNQGGPDAWGQVSKVTAADGVAGDQFGAAVSVTASSALGATPYADVGGNVDQGAAYMFHRDEGGLDAWSQVAELTAGDGAAADWFGVSVSVSFQEDKVIVGANGADPGGNALQGAAYVYYRNLGGLDAWGQEEKLTAADGAPLDLFGSSVSFCGYTVLVGAPWDDVPGKPNQGAAYVYYTPFNIHVQLIYLAPIEPQPGLKLVLGLVRIVDWRDVPVAGATVDVEWTLPTGYVYPMSATTSSAGLAVPIMVRNWSGTYELCVTNVSKAGLIYDFGANVETCDSIQVP